MDRSFWLFPRDVPRLVEAIARRCVGGGAMYVEGDAPSHVLMLEGMGATHLRFESESPDALYRYVVPLEEDTIDTILARLLSPGVLASVDALQIANRTGVQFIAGDNFHNECVSVGKSVSEQYLAELVAAGILTGYHPHRGLTSR